MEIEVRYTQAPKMFEGFRHTSALSLHCCARPPALKFSFCVTVALIEAILAAKMNHHKPSADPLYRLLRNEEVGSFNQQRESEKSYDFRGCSFRGSDLRGLDARGLDLRDAYFRDADLRGVDLRQALLEGASLGSAKISGAYFPDDVSAEEIRLSVEYGTRLRVAKRAG